jgi:lysophospholipase L1-like esterase
MAKQPSPPANGEAGESRIEQASAPGGAAQRRLLAKVPLLGAIALALIASAISVGVVLKANRFEATCRILSDIVRDPAGLEHYALANARILGSPRYAPGELTIVYGSGFGADWVTLRALEDEGVVNRSIPEQTTLQLLLRMEQDVLALQPARMLLLLPAESARAPRQAALHARILCEIAEGSQIRPILASVPPVPAEHDTIPGGYIGGLQMLNRELADLAARQGWQWLDLHAALVGDDYYLRDDYRADRPWPNARGYRTATEMVAAALAIPVGGEEGDPAATAPGGSDAEGAPPLTPPAGLRLAER